MDYILTAASISIAALCFGIRAIGGFKNDTSIDYDA